MTETNLPPQPAEGRWAVQPTEDAELVQFPVIEDWDSLVEVVEVSTGDGHTGWIAVQGERLTFLHAGGPETLKWMLTLSAMAQLNMPFAEVRDGLESLSGQQFRKTNPHALQQKWADALAAMEVKSRL